MHECSGGLGNSRGGSIEDLKLRRKGEEEETVLRMGVYSYEPRRGRVSSYPYLRVVRNKP